MRHKTTEPDNLSPARQVQQISYPASREEIVQTAADNEAPAVVINFLKCLPKARYESLEQVWRDFAEAERRFGVSGRADGPSRENIGRTIIEETLGVPTHHP